MRLLVCGHVGDVNVHTVLKGTFFSCVWSVCIYRMIDDKGGSSGWSWLLILSVVESRDSASAA